MQGWLCVEKTRARPPPPFLVFLNKKYPLVHIRQRQGKRWMLFKLEPMAGWSRWMAGADGWLGPMDGINAPALMHWH